MKEKEQAKGQIRDLLTKHRADAVLAISRNKLEMSRLVEAQTVLKRKLVEIDEIIKGIEL
jgi:hypothetical protein